MILKVPSSVFSMLGVKVGKVDTHPGRTSGVFTFGFDGTVKAFGRGRMVMSPNSLEVEYGASTLPSWSGTPVINKRSEIVAVHTIGGVEENRGVAVFPFFRKGKPETASFEEFFNEAPSDSEDRFDNEYVDSISGLIVKVGQKYFVNQGPEEDTHTPYQTRFGDVRAKSWANQVDEAEDDLRTEEGNLLIGTDYRGRYETVYVCHNPSCSKITDEDKCCFGFRTSKLDSKKEKELKEAFALLAIDVLRERIVLSDRLQSKLERTLNKIGVEYTIGAKLRADPSNTLGVSYDEALDRMKEDLAEMRRRLSQPPEYRAPAVVSQKETLNSTAPSGQASGAKGTTPGTRTVTHAEAVPSSSQHQKAKPPQTLLGKSPSTTPKSPTSHGPRGAVTPSAPPSPSKTEGEQSAPKRRRNRRGKASKPLSSGSTPAVAI